MLLALIVGLSGCAEGTEAKAKGKEYLNILALCIIFYLRKEKE